MLLFPCIYHKMCCNWHLNSFFAWWTETSWMLKLYFYECLGTLNFSGLLNASNFMLPCIKQHSHIRAQKFHSYIILLFQLPNKKKKKEAEANQNNIFKSFPVFSHWINTIAVNKCIVFDFLKAFWNFFEQILFILKKEKCIVASNSNRLRSV